MNPDFLLLVLIWVCGVVLGLTIFYLLVRYAVKHGVQDALEDRDRGL